MYGGDFQCETPGSEHWMDFFNVKTSSEEDTSFYLTITIDLKNDTVSLYSLGSSVGTNKCNEGYLDSCLICDNTIPFTVGVMVSGNPARAEYSKFLLYGCRLYDRVLSDEEIELNYNESKSLLEN